MKQKNVIDVPVSEIVEFWNECIGNSFPMTQKLWIQNTLQDSNVLKEASIVIYENGQLIGLVVAKRYQEKLQTEMSKYIGWIQCLLVRKIARNRGIGQKLLNHVEKKFNNLHLREIRLGRDPWHYFPGVPLENIETIKWFERRGYKKESIEIDLRREVRTVEPYKLTNPTHLFRVLTREEIPKLLSFLKQVFPGRWHYEALRYANINGSGREFMGFFIDNELKGFCRMNDPQSPLIAQNVYWSSLFKGPLGGIGPLGIDRHVRGNQYGIDLVKAASNELILRGMHHIVIDWTQLVTFYEKLEYVPWKHYETMSKSI
ncbi:GNAT family N-acetyltransferase [Psychrobacillus sp. FSL H8-0483]|uniref:GNAT family N-acetyltransferase n=1 Tax=Psychrobacillus sp. FSL H8-0483 TaxID=2921389 RepID=UPI00315ABCD7